MTFKKVIGKLHLYLGLASGILVFFISITGCIFVFSTEIFDLLHKDLLYVEEVKSERLPVDEIWDNAQEALGETPIMRTGLYNDPERTWTFMIYKATNSEAITWFDFVDEYKTAYIDPYTGKVHGVLDNEAEFFTIIKMLHWSLGLKTEYGQPIVGYATLVFVVMLISGMVLWWPKNKKGRKQRLTFKFKANWRRVNFDLHNVAGFYISLVALLIALTGMVWAFTWFKNTVYVVASQSVSPPESVIKKSTPREAKSTLILEDIYRQTKKAYPDAYRFSLSKPKDSVDIVRANVQILKGLYYKSAALQYDQYSRELLHHKRYEDQNAGEKVIRANYDIHVGAILGLPGKVLAFIASLVCASLPVTGFLIWWGRRKKKIQKNRPPRFTKKASTMRRQDRPVMKRKVTKMELELVD